MPYHVLFLERGLTSQLDGMKNSRRRDEAWARFEDNTAFQPRRARKTETMKL